jgi:hypothetical protein
MWRGSLWSRESRQGSSPSSPSSSPFSKFQIYFAVFPFVILGIFSCWHALEVQYTVNCKLLANDFSYISILD